jgi:hypothetical protein
MNTIQRIYYPWTEPAIINGKVGTLHRGTLLLVDDDGITIEGVDEVTGIDIEAVKKYSKVF